MIAVCPSCKFSMTFELKDISHGSKISCCNCSSVFRVVKKQREESLQSKAGPIRDEVHRSTLLVAHEKRAFCNEVAVLLADIADVHFTHDGDSTLEAIDRLRPDVALIDVGLPGMYGFQVCEKVREQSSLQSVKLILLCSLHDRNRYIHPPTSLYGADALIEQDRIDGLEKLIKQLLYPSVSC